MTQVFELSACRSISSLACAAPIAATNTIAPTTGARTRPQHSREQSEGGSQQQGGGGFRHAGGGRGADSREAAVRGDGNAGGQVDDQARVEEVEQGALHRTELHRQSDV